MRNFHHKAVQVMPSLSNIPNSTLARLVSAYDRYCSHRKGLSIGLILNPTNTTLEFTPVKRQPCIFIPRPYRLCPCIPLGARSMRYIVRTTSPPTAFFSRDMRGTNSRPRRIFEPSICVLPFAATISQYLSSLSPRLQVCLSLRIFKQR